MQWIEAVGVVDRVRVDLCDYRMIRPVSASGYDAVVSIEMIEAVGERYWPTYFRTLDRLLAPGGTAVIQAITTSQRRMLDNRDLHTWMRKYIFPGGLIPSVEAIAQVCHRDTGLRVRDIQAFGSHYAETLRLWRERFTGTRDLIAALGFDETFRRTWELYLSYCEAGFRTGCLDVHHLVMERPA